ncbi:hypothetical protein MMC14_002249 [Varicellaria rhodocarpa]|nr:hypothetical protein [Varicellaria rhodocarpa]
MQSINRTPFANRLVGYQIATRQVHRQLHSLSRAVNQEAARIGVPRHSPHGTLSSMLGRNQDLLDEIHGKVDSLITLSESTKAVVAPQPSGVLRQHREALIQLHGNLDSLSHQAEAEEMNIMMTDTLGDLQNGRLPPANVPGPYLPHEHGESPSSVRLPVPNMAYADVADHVSYEGVDHTDQPAQTRLPTWECCVCRDGPKLVEIQPACVICEHLYCANCPTSEGDEIGGDMSM